MRVPNKELQALNRELEVTYALGIAPKLYEVWVYRKGPDGVYKSQEWLGVAGITPEHAAAKVYEEENPENHDPNFIWTFHHVKVMGPLDLPGAFTKTKGLVPVKRAPKHQHEIIDKHTRTAKDYHWHPDPESGQKKMKTTF